MRSATVGELPAGELLAVRPGWQTLKRVDVFIYAALFCLGALQFWLVERSADYLRGDVTFFELARSLAQTHQYGYNFHPETVLPPGFPLLLAIASYFVGFGHLAFLRLMPVFGTLGFAFSYELLKREGGRVMGASSCLLLASSPVFFALSTRWVYSDLPYFCLSMAALLAAGALLNAKPDRSTGWLSLLLCFLTAGAVLVRTAGIALPAAIAASLAASCAASWLTGKKMNRRLLKAVLPAVFAAILMQALWSAWAKKVDKPDWPTLHYPGSYVEQLKWKDANQPDLGTTSVSDLPARALNNMRERAALLAQMCAHVWIEPDWCSPAILGLVLLIAIGLGASLGKNGGNVWDWYFVFSEIIYLTWPWHLEPRFLIPLAPLACLYLWRGGSAVWNALRLRPRLVGIAICLLGVGLTSALVFQFWLAHQAAGLQIKSSLVFWAFCVALGMWMTFQREPRLQFGSMARFRRLLAAIATVAVSLIVLAGVFQQLQLGKENLAGTAERYGAFASDIAAAKWIRSHTAADAVVLARYDQVLYHYSGRKTIFFPPVNKPLIIMDGIRSHHIQYVVVVRRDGGYFLPSEGIIFRLITKCYPQAFQQVYATSSFTIFRVTSCSIASTRRFCKLGQSAKALDSLTTNCCQTESGPAHARTSKPNRSA